MKRLLCAILASLIMLSFSVKANAEEAIEETTEENVMLVDVLLTANKEEIDEMFKDTPLHSNMDGFDRENTPLMINYLCVMAAYETEDYYFIKENQREKIASERFVAELVMLKDPPGSVNVSDDLIMLANKREEGYLLSYYTDLMNMKSRREFLGQEVQISNVTGFTTRMSGGLWDITTLVYETDKGLFVEYYDGNDAEPVEFRWEDYIQKELAYRAYIKASYSGLYMGGVSFLDFCENPEKYVVPSEPQQPTEPQPEAPGNTQPQENKPAEKKDYTIVIIAASALGVVALTAGAILVLRKKKR